MEFFVIKHKPSNLFYNLEFKTLEEFNLKIIYSKKQILEIQKYFELEIVLILNDFKNTLMKKEKTLIKHKKKKEKEYKPYNEYQIHYKQFEIIKYKVNADSIFLIDTKNLT